MITEPFEGQRIKIRAWDLFTVPYAKTRITHEEYMAGKTFYGTVTNWDLRGVTYESGPIRDWSDCKVSVDWDDKRLQHTRLAAGCLIPVTPDEDIVLAMIEQKARDGFDELRQQFAE
jgi:hypothetical protein